MGRRDAMWSIVEGICYVSIIRAYEMNELGG